MKLSYIKCFFEGKLYQVFVVETEKHSSVVVFQISWQNFECRSYHWTSLLLWRGSPSRNWGALSCEILSIPYRRYCSMCFSSCSRVQSTQENWLLGSDLCLSHASVRSVRQSCLGVTKHLNINNCDANESGILVKKNFCFCIILSL